MIKQKFTIEVKIIFLILTTVTVVISLLILFFTTKEKELLITLGISPKEIELFINRVSQELILFLGITILVLLIILSILVKKILSPIFKLSLATRTVASGNLDYPIELKTQDEIGEIAKDFTVIERSLKATIRDLRERNKEIELLSKITTKMTTRLNSQEIIGLIIEDLTTELGYDYILVSKLSEDGEYSQDHIFSGDTQMKQAIEDILEEKIENIKAPVSKLPFLPDVSSGKIVIKERLADFIGEVIGESQSDAIQLMLGAKNFVDVPLHIKEKPTYLLLIATSKETITKHDKDILHTFMRAASIGLENALLYEEKTRWADELEKKVEERTKELEEMTAKIAHQEKMVALGTMASRMSHELKNPLAIIRSNVYFLKKKVPMELMKYLDMIGRAEERSNIVVEETMGFVKGVSLKKELANINDCIEEALRSLSHELKKVEVEKEFSEDIPSVLIDVHWIHNLFTNIFINAVQAMEEEGVFHPEGELIGKITIKSCVVNSNIEVSISDTGKGVPQDIKDRIFDPFFGTKIRGTGLGLSISREIIEKHKGSINVFNNESGGATFTVVIPIPE